jgi:hypothetical protein
VKHTDMGETRSILTRRLGLFVGKVGGHQPKLPYGHTESVGLETLGRCTKETEFYGDGDTSGATVLTWTYFAKANRLLHLPDSPEAVVAHVVVV